VVDSTVPVVDSTVSVVDSTVPAATTPPKSAIPEECIEYLEPTPTPPEPVVEQEKLGVMQMYERSLLWADDIVKHVAELDTLIRVSDSFMTVNTNMFAEHGEGSLAKSFQMMSQAVVDTKNTLRDV